LGLFFSQNFKKQSECLVSSKLSVMQFRRWGETASLNCSHQRA
jgi:hypothetical protein